MLKKCNFSAVGGVPELGLRFHNGTYTNYKDDLLTGLAVQGKLGLYPTAGHYLTLPKFGAPFEKSLMDCGYASEFVDRSTR